MNHSWLDPDSLYLFFQIYTVISDKLVGMLLRARKHKIVDFEGECLFQVSTLFIYTTRFENTIVIYIHTERTEVSVNMLTNRNTKKNQIIQNFFCFLSRITIKIS